MLFQMKIQPIDAKSMIKSDPAKQGGKSRWKRLFERQFPKRAVAVAGDGREKEDGGEFEPSSVCLDKLVVSFMEDSNEKAARCARSRCNCFNGNCDDSSDGEFVGDAPPISASGASEILKGLVPCESVTERNLLADTSKIVEASKTKGKNYCIKIVTENLQSLGYDVSICKSKWEKSPSIPAGEYEYIDVIIEGDRYVVDVDFRSEFEIARSTKNYRAVLQSIPLVFVGKSDRIQQIVAVVSEAAKQSLKKKGLHFPPWRKLEYMKSKWLAPYERVMKDVVKGAGEDLDNTEGAPVAISAVNFNGEFEVRGVVVAEPEKDKITVVVSPWTPPAVKPKTATTPGAKIVTGLASVLTESCSPSPTKF